MKKLSYMWRRGLWALLSLLFMLIIVITSLYIYLETQLPDVESLKNVNFQEPLRIYSEDGKLIQEYGEKRRIPLTYAQIPQILVKAVLATEDQRFFEHPGVDIMGLGRAAIRMVKTGTRSQGGSTITMQVARNFFLSRKKTFLRKFKEILLAIKIDKELSKEKILELYLNKIYLGNRAYGVGAAAYVYYGKSLSQLSIAQLAMIAGLPQAPSSQNPIKNPKAAKKRRDHVLERLLEENYISAKQYQNAIIEPLKAKYHGKKVLVTAPYVAEMIRKSIYKYFGEDAYTKGYKVYTTINSDLQNKANLLVQEHLIAYSMRHGYRGPIKNIANIKDKLAVLKTYPAISALQPAVVSNISDHSAQALLKSGKSIEINWHGLSWARPALRRGWYGATPRTAKEVVAVGDIIYITPQQHNNKYWKLIQLPEAEAALIALQPENGAIRTLVGGFSFKKSKFNRVTQMYRQPGSSIKPFIYAAALNKDYTLATLINDAPIVVDDPSQDSLWRPHNSSKKFYGPTRLREGLIRSRNMISIRILDDIGIDYAIDFLTRFGFKKESLPHALSLALGSLSIRPIDLATAYAVFANGGYKINPFIIDHIADSKNEIILKANPVDITTSQAIIPKNIAFLINSALKDVIQKGTARLALSLNRQDIAGKTGTTNEQVDTWFAGFNHNLVVITWIGFDKPRSLYEYASQLALPLWMDYMKYALYNTKEVTMEQPEDIVEVKIDSKSGFLTEGEGIYEYFRESHIPVKQENEKIASESIF